MPPLSTLQAVKDKIDTFAALKVPEFHQNYQSAYFTANGYYWQGVFTHSGIPADGNAVTCDRQDDAPVGLPSHPAWSSHKLLMPWKGRNPNGLEARVAVHAHEQGATHWWSAVVEFLWSGVRYQKAWRVASDGTVSLEFDWRAVPDSYRLPEAA